MHLSGLICMLLLPPSSSSLKKEHFLEKVGNDEHLRQAFMYFDQNKSGYIEIDELRSCLADDLGPASDDEVINAIIRDVDVDKDGNISYEEFTAMMKAGTDWRKASSMKAVTGMENNVLVLCRKGASSRGTHTTRHVSLLQLSKGGYLADTPGFNQPSLTNVTTKSLAETFSEYEGSKWYREQRVGPVSKRSGRGTRTTRHVSLLPFSKGGYLADTPGFNHPSLTKVTTKSLAETFPEIRERLRESQKVFVR